MDYSELVETVVKSSGDMISAAYTIGFEEGKKYVMEQLQKFLEENGDAGN